MKNTQNPYKFVLLHTFVRLYKIFLFYTSRVVPYSWELKRKRECRCIRLEQLRWTFCLDLRMKSSGKTIVESSSTVIEGGLSVVIGELHKERRRGLSPVD